MEQPIIEVENLSKLYRLGVIGTTTLQESLERCWYRMRGNEEQLQKVGTKNLMIAPDDPQAGPEPNSIWALKDVSFSVQKGEIVGIIGKNGAGKSTLLKILTRITEPTSGRAIIEGRVASLLEVGTGFHQELTGRENVYLNGAILGMRKAEIDDKFDEIVAFSGIENFIDTPVKRYSSGMYVRLAFAVAAHLEPEILLVDEVLAVGDVEFQKKCLGKMSEVAAGGRTVLFVSHNMTSIKVLCDKAILLQNGQIGFNGEVSEAVEKYLASSSTEHKNVPIAERKRESKCSLRAKIIGIEVITEYGENPKYLDSKRPFTVRLIVQSFSDSNIRCSAQIKITDEMQPLSFFDSATLYNKFYNIRKGVSLIDCEISPLHFYGGNYKIDCGLTIPGQEVIDYVENAYSFEVIEFDPYGTGYNLLKSYGFGLFHIDHQWKEMIQLERY